MIKYFTKYRNEIFQYAIIKSDAKPSSIKELTISHLHSYLGMRGYIEGIGAMSAEERMAVSEKRYENGLGSMAAEKRMAAYENGIGAMSAEERMAASEKGYKNGRGRQRVKREYKTNESFLPGQQKKQHITQLMEQMRMVSISSSLKHLVPMTKLLRRRSGGEMEKGL